MAGKEIYMNLLDYYDMETPYATEFRRLLHNLNGSAINDNGDRPKTILVTSAMLSEGKSTVTAFLAMTAARHKGRRTLLVDCDLRRPTLHRLFNMPREHGVVEALKGDIKVKNVIKKTTEDNLHVITAGRYVPQPTEVFDSVAIRKMIDEVSFYYDLILVDCAPVLPVSDPMLLATEVDGVIMVVKAGATQREVVERAANLIKNSRCHFLGVVLNNLANVLPYYYNGNYYGYEYDHRGDAKTKPAEKTPKQK